MARVPKRGAESEILPRYVFLESLLPGAKVLEIDAVSLTAGRSARFLLERGAALVTAVDADAEAVERAQQDEDLRLENLELRAADFKDLGSGDYDLVIIHSAEKLSDRNRLIALKHQLASTGRLVVVLRREGGLALSDAGKPKEKPPSDAELQGQLRKSFQSVEVAVQRAFVGYSIVPASVEEPATALDESLADNAPPAYSLYLCGTRPSGLDTTSLTPLPSEVMRSLVEGQRPDPATAFTGFLDEVDQDLQDQRLRELEERTQAALEEVQRSELALAQALAERDHLRTRLRALEESPAVPPAPPVPAPEDEARALARQAELEELRLALARTQAALEARVSEVASLTQALEQTDQETQAGAEELATLRDELNRAKKYGQAVQAELMSVSAQVEKQTAELAVKEAQIGARDAQLETSAEERDRARAVLQEREAEAARLSGELARAQADIEARDTELQAAVEALHRARAELKEKGAELQARSEQLAGAKEAVEATNAQHAAALQAQIAARQEVEARAQELASALETVQSLEAEVVSLRAQLMEARAALAQTRAEAQGHAAGQAELEALRQRAEGAEAEVALLTESQERVAEDIRARAALVDSLRQDLEAAQARAAEEIARRAGDLDQVRMELEQSQQRVAAQLQQGEEQAERLKEDLAEERSLSSQRGEALHRLEEELQTARLDLDGARRQLSTLQDKLEAGTTEVERERLLATASRSELAALGSELELVRSEAEQLLTSLMDRQADLQREEAARAQAEKGLAAAAEEIRDLRAKLEAQAARPLLDPHALPEAEPAEPGAEALGPGDLPVADPQRPPEAGE